VNFAVLVIAAAVAAVVDVADKTPLETVWFAALTSVPATAAAYVMPAAAQVAPAGLTRGVITNASNVGYVNSEGEFIPVALTGGQRDTLYANRINPMANFPGQGLYVFGQKTLQRAATALDRINVGRLLAYLRERFDPLARPFIFEPNDKITRTNAKAVFDAFLGDMIAKRAIYDYIVVCDETNNSPARIDKNELWIDVAIEPTKAAEFIYIPIRVVNTGDLGSTN
jgi:phage tail sheath protein FI